MAPTNFFPEAVFRLGIATTNLKVRMIRSGLQIGLPRKEGCYYAVTADDLAIDRSDPILACHLFVTFNVACQNSE